MSKSLAIEYAKKNITINCVSPGFIQSKMTDKISESVKEVLASRIAMGKLGTGEDVATSSPVPNFPIAILDAKTSLTDSEILSVIFDCINPGETQLIVIFFFAYSIAKDLLIPIIPDFEAE